MMAACNADKGITAMFPQTMRAKFSLHSPLQRIVEPNEVAAAVYFMSTDTSSAITGENIPVTTGFEIGTGQPKHQKNNHVY